MTKSSNIQTRFIINRIQHTDKAQTLMSKNHWIRVQRFIVIANYSIEE